MNPQIDGYGLGREARISGNGAAFLIGQAAWHIPCRLIQGNQFSASFHYGVIDPN